MTDTDIRALAEAISGRVIICSKPVLTADEAAQYMGISKSGLYKLLAARKIPHSKPNGKVVFFKREQLEAWLMSNPVATDEELDAAVDRYCRNKPIKLKR